MSFQNCQILGRDINAKQYHEGKGVRGDKNFRVSPSMLKAFMASPSKWFRGYNYPDSASKDWGNLLDVRLLTPDQFSKVYAIEPETYVTSVMECPSCKSQTDSKKCAKCGVERVKVSLSKPWNNLAGECREWIAVQGGKEIVASDKVNDADKAIARLHEDDIISAWHAASDKQVLVTGEWHDKATGLVIPVECLIDYVPRKDTEFKSSLGDLKSTTNGALRPFAKWCCNVGYHQQGSFDLDLFNSATGEERQSWVLILSENYAPWEVGKRLLSLELIEIGRAWYRMALTHYVQCLASDTWPGYDDHKDAVQGWSVIEPEKYMSFDLAEQMVSVQPQTETIEEEENFDVAP